MKKLLLIILVLIALTGCSSKGEYIPTALITNITYNETNETIKFQVDISDKSNTIEKAWIELYKDGEKISEQTYKENNTYTFNNVEADEIYIISIRAEYTINKITVENKEIYKYDITNIISTIKPYLTSIQVEYDGNKHSIYLENIDESKYDIAYLGNAVSEIGTHKVIAVISLNNEEIERFEAYIVITQATPELVIYDQEYSYTGEPINAQYKLTPEVEVKITYNNQTTAPTEVGVYDVVVSTIETKEQKQITKQAVLKIIKADITITNTTQYKTYDGNIQSVEIQTNIECETEIKYYQNNIEVSPINPGEYDVIITIEDTQNYNGLIKLSTLTIIDEDSIENDGDLIISQISYQNAFDIVIELYNPTSEQIELNNYSILLGTSTNEKRIELNNILINPYQTYTIASTATSYTNIKFNQYSNYLVYDQNISLIKDDEILDNITLTNNTNLIRKNNINEANDEFDIDEWEETNVSSTFNNHDYDILNTLTTSHLEIYFSSNIIINYGEELNYNNYIYVYDSIDGRIYINDEMYETNLDVYLIGKQIITFTISNSSENTKIFTIEFEIKDISSPVFTPTNNSLVFDKNDEIDYVSLVEVSDNYDEDVVIYVDSSNVDNTKEGAYKVIYKALDSSNNETIFTLYIFIK